MEKVKVILYGVSAVGSRIAKFLLGKNGVEIVGVVMIANSIPKVINAPPGLVTMKDLPIPSVALKDMRKYIH